MAETKPTDFGALGTERRNPRSMNLDRMSTTAILRLINSEDRRVPVAVGRQIRQIAKAVDAVVRAVRNGGRVFYVGAGTSGRVGLLDALEWPPTFGVSADLVRVIIAGGAQATIGSAAPAEDDRDGGAAQMAAAFAGSKDVVIGIAASGVTPFVLGAVEEARRRGCVIIGLTNVRGAPLARAADVAIVPDVGPEVLTGSTRMKAGTSQKLVLNMISTTAMVRLGKTYTNLMVDMQTTNRKLAARAQRMVMQAAGVDAETASQLLDESGGSVKVAVVRALTGVAVPDAVRLLTEAEGHVRRAVRAVGGDRQVKRRTRAARR
jgi:N-acetylmuramic acid 6-phosphate etherase